MEELKVEQDGSVDNGTATQPLEGAALGVQSATAPDPTAPTLDEAAVAAETEETKAPHPQEEALNPEAEAEMVATDETAPQLTSPPDADATAAEDQVQPEEQKQRIEAAEGDADADADAEDEKEPIGHLAAASSNTSRSRRQRSASTIKELASLGLGSLGDGEEVRLAPRRSRRANTADEGSKEGTSAEAEGDNTEVVADEKPNGGASRNSSRKHVDGDGDVKMDDATTATGDTANYEQLELEEGMDADGGGDEGVTRCVCGSADENVGLMIQCETCKCWQHCVCMGMHTEEECPDVYYCEQCRPELHIELLRSLGVLPPARSKKSGGGKSRPNAREQARELKAAKDAVRLLAENNAKRIRDGEDPILRGYPSAGTTPGATVGLPAQGSASKDRISRSSSTDANDLSTPKSPKRRSTMNSRDSAYGWEPIPPELLLEGQGEEGGAEEDEEERQSNAKKRKRKASAQGAIEEEQRSLTPEEGDAIGGPAENAKRRRMSASATAAPTSSSSSSTRRTNRDEERERESSPVVAVSKSKKKQPTSRLAQSTTAEEDGATPVPSIAKPKHPNQYTYRNKERDRLAVAAATNNGSLTASVVAANKANGAGAARNTSPSPSPSKNKPEGGRRGALRDRGGGDRDATAASRHGTPLPQAWDAAINTKATHPGAQWGMPEHLSHLANLLAGPTPSALTLHFPSTKGMGKNGSTATTKRERERERERERRRERAAREAAAAAGNGSGTSGGRARAASPVPYQLVEHLEPPTRIRFPLKRMTLGEMRKRVKNIGDFLTRTQVEAVERRRRKAALNLDDDDSDVEEDEEEEEEGEGPPGGDAEAAAVANAGEAADITAALAAPVDSVMEGADGTAELAPNAVNGDNAASRPTDVAAAGEQPQNEVAAPSASASPKTSVAAPAVKRTKTKRVPTMDLVDELSRELMAFHQKYGINAIVGSAAASGGAATSGTSSGAGTMPKMGQANADVAEAPASKTGTNAVAV